MKLLLFQGRSPAQLVLSCLKWRAASKWAAFAFKRSCFWCVSAEPSTRSHSTGSRTIGLCLSSQCKSNCNFSIVKTLPGVEASTRHASGCFNQTVEPLSVGVLCAVVVTVVWEGRQNTQKPSGLFWVPPPNEQEVFSFGQRQRGGGARHSGAPMLRRYAATSAWL